MMGVLGYVIIEVDQGRAPFLNTTESVAAQDAPSDKAMSYFSANKRSTSVEEETLERRRAPAGATEWKEEHLGIHKVPRMESADDMSRRQLGELKDRAASRETDRLESLDDSINRKGADYKGGGRGFGGAPAEKPMNAPPASNALSLQEGQQQNGAYSYRNSGPAQQPADAERFNPGEAKQLLARSESKVEQLRKSD